MTEKPTKQKKCRTCAAKAPLTATQCPKCNGTDLAEITVAPRNPNNPNLRAPWGKGESGCPGGAGNPEVKARKELMRQLPITDRYAALIEMPLPNKMCKQLRLKKGATWGDAIAIGQVAQAVTKVNSAREVREAIEGRSVMRVQIVPGLGSQSLEELLGSEDESRRQLPSWAGPAAQLPPGLEPKEITVKAAACCPNCETVLCSHGMCPQCDGCGDCAALEDAGELPPDEPHTNGNGNGPGE